MGSTVTRDVRLSGRSATEWLNTRSIFAVGSAHNPSVFADELTIGDFTARRFWTNLTAWRWSFSTAGDQVGVAVIVEGHGTLDGRGVHPGNAILMVAGAELNLRFNNPVALAQMVTTRERIPATTDGASVTNSWIESPRFGPFFLSSIMSLFVDDMKPPLGSGFEDARRSVEFAASAVVSSAMGARPAGTSTQRTLYARAVELINARAHEPDLSVDSIIRLLNSSKSNVHRAFDAAGTSPSQMLRAARVQKARGLLADRVVTTKTEAERIARAAGFRSARSMRAAIAETRQTGDPRFLRSGSAH